MTTRKIHLHDGSASIERGTLVISGLSGRGGHYEVVLSGLDKWALTYLIADAGKRLAEILAEERRAAESSREVLADAWRVVDAAIKGTKPGGGS